MAEKPEKKRERFYPTGARGRRENMVLCESALHTLSQSTMPDSGTRIGIVKHVMKAVKQKNVLERANAIARHRNVSLG